MKVKIIGIPWYRKENYSRFKSLFVDGHNLPDTFDDWLKKSQDLLSCLQSQGHIIEKVYIDPDTFPEWCRRRGLDINSRARTDFANDFVARKYIN